MIPHSAEFPEPPIHRLPYEVLLHTFSFYMGSYDEEMQRSGLMMSSLNTKEGPWPLTQVCQSWREITISTATFWANISYLIFSGIDPEYRHPTYFRRLISLQIERSRNLPLSIMVFMMAGLSSTYAQPLAEMLLRNRYRWKILQLCGAEIRFLYASIYPLLSPPLECPLLERLDTTYFTFFLTDAEGRQSPITDLFASYGCPKLKTAVFRLQYPPAPALPWSQIEELELHKLIPYISEFLRDIHGQLTNLTKLRIDRCEDIEYPPTPYPLPGLRSLRIGAGSSSSILQAISAPSLEELIIDQIHPPHEYRLATVASIFLERSQCHITSFRGHFRSSFGVKLFLPVFRKMRLLQQLEVHIGTDGSDCYYFADILNRRDLSSGSFVHCPQLRRLLLFCESWEESDPPDLSELVLRMMSERSTAACMAEDRPFEPQMVKLIRERSWRESRFSGLEGCGEIQMVYIRLR